jgi:hypothetical protein
MAISEAGMLFNRSNALSGWVYMMLSACTNSEDKPVSIFVQEGIAVLMVSNAKANVVVFMRRKVVVDTYFVGKERRTGIVPRCAFRAMCLHYDN